MKMKRMVQTLALISVLATTLILTTSSEQGAHVDEHWSMIITNSDAYASALFTHAFDAGRLRPVDIDPAMDHGFTITSMKRIGQTFLFENNRVWPFGIPYIYTIPDDPKSGYKDPAWLIWEDEAESFRKALHRLINMDEVVVEIYTDPVTGIATHSKAERWLPPGMETWTALGQEPWIPDIELPSWDPVAAAALLDGAGFVQGTTSNPDYDPGYPGSAEYIRIDPTIGTDLSPFEYYAIGPVEAPLGFNMAIKISDWFKKAGIPNDLVAGSQGGVFARLSNPVLEDYQMMTGIGIAWDTTAPDVLYDFTYSKNVPLWNHVYMNISEIDEAGIRMMSTLNITACRQAAYNIQTVLADHEPYLPLLLDNGYAAFAGETDPLVPSWEGPGCIGIVNAVGYGALGFDNLNLGLLRPPSAQGCNPWGKMLGRGGSTLETNIWGLGQSLNTLNPLTAHTASEWQVLSLVEDYLFKRHPYTMGYMWWAAESMPTMELWIGPGSSEFAMGNGVYDAAFNGTHYDGIPIADVTADDLVGDDKLGKVTTWKLRNDTYWHDSDPGPDAIHGTGDEPGGSVHKVTTADIEYAASLAMGKEYFNCTAHDAYENIRYYSTWRFFAGYIEPNDGTFAVEIVDDQTFRIYEERRYVFAFEAHNALLSLVPKHIWEPYVEGPDGTKGTEDDGDPAAWTGWEDTYMLDPVRQRLGLSDMDLSYLIGFGPFVYHVGGWEPSVSAHVEANPSYFGGTICPADINFDRIVDDLDIDEVVAGIGYYDVKADICFPAQVIRSVDELNFVYAHLCNSWGPGPPPSFDIAVLNVTPSKTVVGAGYNVNIMVTTENQGDYTESFNVTAYADLETTTIGDEIVIGTQNGTLTSGDSTTVTFAWNTTGVPYGNYTISASAALLQCETDTEDNTYINGIVTVMEPTVSVYPTLIVGPPPKITETFTVNITITAIEDLYTWQAGMTFNATVLECIDIAEGEFLKRAGVSTLWTPGTIDNTNGKISYSACSLTGATLGVNGTGQLMNITFRVKNNGKSTLHLTDVLLLDSNLLSISPFNTTDGHVEIYLQDLAILDVTISATEAYPTWIVPLNITVVAENQGTRTETFNVTVYANAAEIGIQEVTLAEGANTTLVFSWSLTSVTEGNYTIRAEASILYGELDTADNTLIDGTVKIKHPGDANDDSVVNAHDLGILAKAWETSVGDPLYDPRADFNGDGTIDTLDHDILKAYWP